MDSWVPWTITRNFIRAFCPTLIILISLDMWRNLGHEGPAKLSAILADAVALCVVLAMRLATPFSACEELKILLHRLWGAAWMISTLEALEIFFKPSIHNFHQGLILICGWAFCMDMGRVCGIPAAQARKWLGGLGIVILCAAVIFWGTIRILLQLWRGMFYGTGGVIDFGTILLLAILIGFLIRHGLSRQSTPEIQQLGLDR
jgi:hypothetical protein